MADFYLNYYQLAFDDLSFWAFILVFAAIFVVLIIANALIRMIKPLRKSLIPSPVLGGFILLAVLAIYKAVAGKPLFNTFILEMITYHCLGMGFIAVALKTKEKADKSKEAAKKANLAVFDSSLITVSTYLMQGVIGLLVSLILYFALKSWPASGVLVPMGFGQGPGQALNWGINYENNTIDSLFGNFEGGASFGLTIAAMGFLSASLGGVLYLNTQRRKGNIKFVEKDTDTEKVTVETFTGNNEIPASKTIDKLSVQFGLVLIAYAISFGIIYGISKACDASGVKFLINTVKPLFWGFNFIIGTGVAALLKAVLQKLMKKGWCKKQYVNNYLLDRISGLTFDIMVIAAIGSIDFSAFGKKEFIVPLILMCVFAAVATYFYVKHVCKKLFEKDGYFEESFLCMFGMLTGTASTGIILLREIDPDFETPACNNMVFQTLYSLVLGAPIMLLMSFVATNMTKLIIGLVIYAVLFVVMYLLIRRRDIVRFIKMKKGKLVEETAAPGDGGGTGEVADEEVAEEPVAVEEEQAAEEETAVEA